MNARALILIFLASLALGGLLLTAYRGWVRDRCDRVNTAQIAWKYRGAGPPPRPSDVRWHAEHCWHYNPR